ncbi:MAG: hypothetical protein AB7E42_09875 [Anaerotignaceae bacterium]
MAVIGSISMVVIFLCLLAMIITGRKQWLVIWIWCVPIVGMSYFAPSDLQINGLIVVISTVMVIITAYSLWGIKAWYVQGRKKKYVLWTVLFAINYAVIEYYFYQCICLGYINFLNVNKDIPFMAIVTVVASMYVAVIMCKVIITAIDKYFSKKETFVLIQCRPVARDRNSGAGWNRKYAIKGVQNGKEYLFNMTRKAYFMLKSEKSLVMEARLGILGGVYVTSNLYKDDDRRKKRINRLIIRQCAFAVLTVAVLILFVVRIKLGVGFNEIFEEIQNYISK